MKVANKLGLVGLFGLISLLEHGQSAGTNEVSPPIPSADAIIILHNRKDWSIAELNQSAFRYLVSNGSMPKDARPQSIAHILPDDKTNMCEFLFVQGFGRPYWRVQVGYDGKIRSFEKRMKKEG